MKILIACFVFLAFCSFAWAQEPPEPGVDLLPTVDPAEDFQIKWGTGAWEAITVDSYEILPGTVDAPQIAIGGLGSQHLEADVDPLMAEKYKCVFSFSVTVVPNARYWWGDVFRVRWRTRSCTDTQQVVSEWSTASYWKAIITLRQPGSPTHP